MLTASAVLFTACMGKTDGTSPESTSSVVSETAVSDMPVPFESFSTIVSDGSAHYLLTLSGGAAGFHAVMEDNTYSSSSADIPAPEGFMPILPRTAANAHDICSIISNDIDDSAVPDIIRLYFTDGTTIVSRLYSIKNNTLTPISIYIDGEPIEYLPQLSLYHSEPLKFISSIVVDEAAGIVPDINDMVKLRTLAFDPDTMTMNGSYEELTPDDPLYFGYAYWGLANNTARYFTESSFAVSDYDNHIEVPDPQSPETPYYYFKVDDSRFSDTDDIMAYLNKQFSEAASQKLFDNAPQKYCDIDGELYTLSEQAVRDSTLGTLTFTGYSVTDEGNIITYRTRQAKYDENGIFTGYVNGGDFQITKRTDWLYSDDDGEYHPSESWIVTLYRYPYRS